MKYQKVIDRSIRILLRIEKILYDDKYSESHKDI